MPKRFTQQSAAAPSPIAEITSNYLADEQALVAALADAADPGESNDLAPEEPERVAAMVEEWTAWRESCRRSTAGEDY